MTKMKSKKMSKSTLAIIIMAVALVALLAFGGTYAYFTATTYEKTTGSFTTGAIKLKSNSANFTQSMSNVMPGQVIIGSTPLKVNPENSTEAVYLALQITVTATKADHETAIDLAAIDLEVSDILTLEWASTTGNGIADGVYVYNPASGEAPNITYALSTVAANAGDINVTKSDVVFNANDNWSESSTYGTINAASDNGLMGATVEISIVVKALQTSNLTALTGENSITNAVIAGILFPTAPAQEPAQEPGGGE